MPHRSARTRVTAVCAVTVPLTGWMLVSRGLPGRVATMFDSGLPSNPWFVPESAGLLYLLFPLTVLAGIVAWLLPGLLFGAARRRDLDFAPWMLEAFLVSLVAQWSLGAAAILFSSGRTADSSLVGGWVVLTLLSLVAYLVREARGPAYEPEGSGQTARRLVLSAVLVVAGVVLLLPQVAWKDIGPDGFEALEMGRSLAWFALPRTPSEASILGLGAGMVPQTVPIRWFIALYGPIEASARLPLFLCLPPLLAGLLGLAETRAPRRLRGFEDAGVALGLAMVVAVVGLNATYSRYLVDLASPTAIEFGAVVLVLGALLALWRNEATVFLSFAGLALLARPTAVVIVALAALATIVIDPSRRRATGRLLLTALGLWLTLYLLFDRLFMREVPDGAALTADSLIDRFQYLTFTDWRRLIWVAAPAGVLPFLALFRPSLQDSIGRSLSVATLLSFGLVAIPAFVGLHHFVPVMLLPVAVFWRIQAHRETPHRTLLAAYAGLALVLFAAGLPPRFHVDRTFRDLGRRIEVRSAGFGSDDASRHREGLAVARDAATALFLRDWQVPLESTELVGGPHFIYYADRSGVPRADGLIVIQAPSAPAPPGTTVLSDQPRARVFVRDSLAWQRERITPRERTSASALYRVPRATLRPHIGERTGNYDINLSTWPLLWRLFQR